VTADRLLRWRPMRALVLVSMILVWLPACATRTSNHTVVETHVVQIDLRSEKPLFGRKPLPRGFAQPVEISPARIEAILAGIQIDIRPSDDSAIRERRYAIPKKILPKVADAMSRAFAEASPDQELVVLGLRKQMQKGLFNRKYLTSFVAYVQGDEMVIHLSRVDWKTDEQRRGSKLPYPDTDKVVMPFATVPTELYTTVGQQAVKVDWQAEAFGEAAIQENVAGGRSGEAPDETADTGVTDADSDVDSVEQGPIDEATIVTGAGVAGPTSGAGTEATGAQAEGVAKPDSLRGLTPDDLRQLADLEEARVSGRVDVVEYETQRRAILDGKP
jgi:hypothetical protein